MAVVVLVALGAAAALYFGREDAGKAFDGSSELRTFATAFIDEADGCAEPPVRTHKQETGLDVNRLPTSG